MSGMSFGFFLISILVWAIGGWITGLVLKKAGLKMKGGYLFLMLLGWGLAGIVGIFFPMYLTNGYWEGGGYYGIYGLIAGAIGGLVTVRQIAKARKKKEN